MLKFLQLCTRNDVSVETISSLPDAIAHVVYLYCIAIVVLVQGSNPFQGSLVYMHAFSIAPTMRLYCTQLKIWFVHQLMKQQQNICYLISTSHILCTYTVYSWVRIPPKNHCTTVYVQYTEYSTDHCALSKRAFTSFRLELFLV